MADNNQVGNAIGQGAGALVQGTGGLLGGMVNANADAFYSGLRGINSSIGPDAMYNTMSGIGQGFMSQMSPQEQPKTKGKSDAAVASPADAPDKYVLNLLLQAATPYIFKMGQQATEATGQVPNPHSVLHQILPLMSTQNGQRDASMSTPTSSPVATPDKSPTTDPATTSSTSPTTTPAASPVVASTPTVADQVNSNIDRKAVNMTAKKGLLGNFAEGFSTGIGLTGKEIENMGALQKLVGGERIQPLQQSEVALRQAQAQEAQVHSGYMGSLGKQVEQQIAGLTPKEQADFQVSMAQNKRETSNQYLQRLDDTIKQHQDFQKTLTESTSIWGRKEKLASNEAIIATLQKVRAQKVAGNVEMNQNDENNVNKYANIAQEDAIKELKRRGK